MTWAKNMNMGNKEIKTWCNHRGETLDSVDNFDVIECEICGFKHIIPLPSVEEMEKAYKNEYYVNQKPLYLKQAKEDLDWFNLVHGERYDFFEKHLSSDRRRILDIGSGPGFFLQYGKARGWDVLGIEPSSQAAAYSRSLGLEIVEDFLTKQTPEKLGLFDVIHMNEVLEHIINPSEMLQIVRKLLKPGGLLFVLVPNEYNPFQYALRTVCGFEPWWVKPPHHINYFDLNSLSNLLSSNGFEIMQKESNFPIDMFLLMGDNYVGNDDLGRKCHAKRKLFEENLSKAGLSNVKQAMYRALAAEGLGREAIVFARVLNE